MSTNMTRRTFLETASAGMLAAAAVGRASAAGETCPAGPPGRFTKTRVLRVYLGSSPSWPKPDLDLNAEVKRLQEQMDQVPGMADVEFLGNELISNPGRLTRLLEESGSIDGVLAVPVCLGTGFLLGILAESGVPTVSLAIPYSGHEWCIVPDMQRAGKKIDVIPTSNMADVATAVRPFRAIHRLKETKLLYVGGGLPTFDEFRAAVKNKLGTEIKPLDHKVLVAVYEAMDPAEVETETARWIKNAESVKEPPREDIAKSARMVLALQKVLADEQAQAITINCLGLFGQKALPAYPCLGFARLNDLGLAGVCEADLASALTQVIYQHLIGRPGFVTDPVIDTSNNTVIHAHCVSATKMDGPDGPSAPYVIRTHLEDHKGAVLQVKMRVGQEITMAKMVSNDPRVGQKPHLAATPSESLGVSTMLISTGQIVEIPDTDRGCRTKITTRVRDARKMLEGWTHGLHRVIFYGNHMADTRRLARFLNFAVVEEG